LFCTVFLLLWLTVSVNPIEGQLHYHVNISFSGLPDMFTEWHTDTQTSRTQFSQNAIRKQYMKLPKHLQIHINIFEHVQIQMNVYIVRKFEQGDCFTELYVH
jgi:hypothetical protein